MDAQRASALETEQEREREREQAGAAAESEAVETSLHLRRGEWVEVKSAEEILATLDERGELEGLPFQPEMLGFCGERLRVYRRADKSCDTISGQARGLRLQRCVHLEDVRCDGMAHGGCQADCLLFWKEAWLRRVEPATGGLLWKRLMASETDPGLPARETPCTSENLEAFTRHPGTSTGETPAFRCQVTQLLEASEPLHWNDGNQYLRDWLSGNVSLFYLVKIGLLRAYAPFVIGRGFSLKVRIYDGLAKLLGESPWPFHPGRLEGRTPRETLDLKPGDIVRVKSHDEILDTLDKNLANRGLQFAPEMVRYCGGTYRVRERVNRILDEQTGEMVEMRSDCIILEDVWCRSECSSHRLFCPRAIYPYWREIWLERVASPDA